MLPKVNQKFPLQTILTVPFVLLVLTTVSITVGLSFEFQANPQRTIVLYGVAFLSTSLLGLLIARWMSQSIQQLSQAIQAIAAGGSSPSLGDSSITELVILSQSVQTMVQRLQTAILMRDLALQGSEGKFTTIFRASPDAIVILSLKKAHLMMVNDSFLQMTGLKSDEWMNPDLTVVQYWQSLATQPQIQTTITTGRQIRDLEIQYPTQSHQEKTALFSAELIELEGQTCLLGIAKDITDRKIAEIALQKQIEQRRILAEISQRIRRSLNLSEILETTVSEIRQLLQVDRVVLYQFNPDWSGVVIVESREDPWPSMLGHTIVDSGLVNNCIPLYARGRIQATPDIHQAGLADCYIGLLEQYQVKANLVLPIVQGDPDVSLERSSPQCLWGLLSVQHCASPREWQADEIELVKQLCDQVAIALQQSELYEQVQRSNRTLEELVTTRTEKLEQSFKFEALLKRITDKVRDSLDESKILETIVSELAIGLQLICCDVAIFDPDDQTITIAHDYTENWPSAQGYTFSSCPPHPPEILQIMAQSGLHQFCLIGKNEARPQQEKSAILSAPILSDQGFLGCLWLFKSHDETFSELEIKLVEQIANQCAISLRQSRLYKAAQNQVETLEKLGHLKDDFLSTVSHELRTPISNINLSIQMLELSLKRLGILESADKVTQYLAILKKECRREIDLINDLLDLTRLEAEADPLVLTDVEPNQLVLHILPPFEQKIRQQNQVLQTWLDPDLPPVITEIRSLERIFMELINNACKYTPSGETITVITRRILDKVEISISNSGVEIPSQERDRLFDKFYRVPHHDPWKHGGTGLGLALVRKLAERLGATITVHSGEGQTTFTLMLGDNTE